MTSQQDIPLVIASSPNEPGYTQFSYSEKTIDKNGVQSQSSILVKKKLDIVPQHLLQFVAPYQLCDSTKEGYRRSTPVLPNHLKNLAVIDSTHSGTQNSSQVYFQILLPILKAFGLPHVYVSTTSPHTIPNHAKSFSSSSTVIFLAGDTSIHEFVNCLTETKEKLKLTIVAIPTGTGNALSTSIGHESVAHAISRLFLGDAVPLSSFKVSFPDGTALYNSPNESIRSLQSVVVTSWGFHASIVADSDLPEYRKLGVERFKKAAQENLEREQIYNGTVSLTNGRIDGPHAYVLFTGVTSLEKGFTISPYSKPPSSNDLYLVQFGHLPGPEIMEIMMAAYNKGSHVKDSRINYKLMESNGQGVIAKVQVHERDTLKRRWCVDGRIVVVGTSGPVTIYRPTHSYHGWHLAIIV